MRFLCPFCNFAVSIDDSARGCRVVCGSCGKSVLAPAGLFDEGRIIGDFAIRSKLGEGANASVYKAYQLSLARLVALKILSPKYTTRKGTAEFLKEARSAAKLSHTNLIQCYAVGEEDGFCYMAMTFIDGETLHARIRREGAIACDEALHIVQQVAEALYYAWRERKIIHRDVKPDNIMLDGNGVVKLTDLGLAMNQSEWREDMEISGSPAYMSPEQFAGEKLDTRSDIYSLGITLYQMLTGELPFSAKTIHSIAGQHFNEEVPNLTKKVPSIPPEVNALVHKMTAKTPKKRFRDMEDLLKEIWAIRQKTAPDKDLVPNVHTISMRRLDYEIQDEAAAASPAKPAVSSPFPDWKKTTGNLVLKYLLTSVPFFAVGALLFLVFAGTGDRSRKDESRNLHSKIRMFEKLSEDTTLPAGELEVEAEKILHTLEAKNDSSIQGRALRSHILLLLKNRHEPQEKEEIAKLKLDLDFAKTENEALHSENEDLRKRTGELLRTDPETLDSLNSEIVRLHMELEAEKEKSAETEKAFRKKNNDLSRFARQRLAGYCFLCWEKQDFLRCSAAIRDFSEQIPSFRDQLDAAANLNRRAEYLCSALTNSKIDYAGRIFATGKKVSRIQDGFIHYYPDGNSNPETRKIPWKDLSSAEAWAIVSGSKELFSDEFPVRALFEIITGHPGRAAHLLPENPLLSRAVNAAMEFHAGEIRRLAAQDQERAGKRFAAFNSRFQGAPAFPAWEKSLTALFPEPKEPEQEKATRPSVKETVQGNTPASAASTRTESAERQ